MASTKDRVAPPGVRNLARRTIKSSLLKDSMTYTKYSFETNGDYTEVDSTIGSGYSNPEHYHTLFTEIFTCTSGELTITLDGKKLALQPGESAKVEIGHTHSLANATNQDVRFMTRLEPGNEGFERAMYIMHGLAEDGLTNQDGVPGNPVTLAVVAALMDTWLTGWVFWMASPLLLVMRRYGKGTGLDARLTEKYWDSD